MKTLVWLSALGVLLFVLGACERQIAPPLVDVTELTPREVEPGDCLEVHGAGFPQGRTGKLTLEGAVFRPGEAPIRSLSVEAEGTVVTPDRLEIVVRDGFAERFCGRGDRATHATFRGDLEVSFASNNQGAPPLVGSLHGVSLDVQPASARASVIESRAAEGRRLLQFLGITPGAPTSRGIPVELVDPSSAAGRAGIQVGDVMVSLDGVHILALSDLLPASARSAELAIRHGDSSLEEVKSLALLEYSSERVPTEYIPALLLLGIGLATLLLVLLPGPPSLATLEMRIAARVRRTTVRALVGHLFGSGRQAAVSALLSAAIGGFALTPYVVSREIDGVVLFAVGASILVWSRLADLRARRPGLRFWAILGALGMMLLAVVAMVGALALTVVQIGAIELAEIAHVQGGAPWSFTGMRHPACAILAVVYGAAIIGIARVSAPARGDGDRIDGRPGGATILLQRIGVLLLAAVGVTAFLGGWQLPGLGDPRTHGLLVAGAVLFVFKTWLAAGFLLGISSALPGADRAGGALPRLVLWRLLPGLILAGGIVAASRRFVPSSSVETTFGATVALLSVLFAVRMAGRIRAAVARPEPHASPFL